jgi:hypothetical protein
MNIRQSHENEKGRIEGYGVRLPCGRWSAKCEVVVFDGWGNGSAPDVTMPKRDFESHDDAARAAVDAAVDWFEQNVSRYD